MPTLHMENHSAMKTHASLSMAAWVEVEDMVSSQMAQLQSRATACSLLWKQGVPMTSQTGAGGRGRDGGSPMWGGRAVISMGAWSAQVSVYSITQREVWERGLKSTTQRMGGKFLTWGPVILPEYGQSL